MRKIKLAILTILLILTSSSTVGAAQRQLTDQQLGILVSLAVDSRWVRQEAANQSLVYGVVHPADQVPTGVTDDDSYIVARDGRAPAVVYYRVGANQHVQVTYPPAGKGRLRTADFTVKQLRRRFFRTVAQRKRVNAYVGSLQTE